ADGTNAAHFSDPDFGMSVPERLDPGYIAPCQGERIQAGSRSREEVCGGSVVLAVLARLRQRQRALAPLRIVVIGAGIGPPRRDRAGDGGLAGAADAGARGRARGELPAPDRARGA